MRFGPFSFVSVIGLSLLGLAACDNDVPVNAPYEPNTIVFAMLDKGDSVHYVKVNKSFINEGRDAREVAKNRDSILPGQSMRVRLEALRPNGENTFYELVRDTFNTKEPGIFPNPQHVLYRTGKVALKPNRVYQLVIDRLKGQEPVKARTPIVGDVRLERPSPTLPGDRTATLPVGFLEELQFDLAIGRHADFYTFHLNTIITSIDTVSGTISQDTANWQIYEQVQPSSGRIEREFETQTYFRVLATAFEKKADVIRPVDSVRARAIVTGGTEDLYTYLQVSEPSLGIVQKRPEFTNLSSGRGIFASRRREVFTYGFSPAGKDSLMRNRFTEDLGFVR